MTLRDALDFALTSLRGNLAKSLLTVLGLFVLRGVRYGWEALSRYFPWRREK